ncbi:MAG: PD-(D/E)XK nuclease family protein [Muribaculaceae bacterium]|nr:PD-(D/E)XK nuclease family protein [Muribaculaceae bacterium]
MSEESLFNKDLPKELTDFLENPELKSIIEEYEKASKECDSAGFNIFTIISDYYFRENFHGDILYAFLNPQGGHGEKHKFLNIFLQMLGLEDSIKYYGSNTIVEKERFLQGTDSGRIDFLIQTPENRHCIIIENKLHDANDMPRQLERYFDEMDGCNEYTVDAIVYLPMSLGNYPHLDKDYEGKFRLRIIPANDYGNSGKSLINDWVLPCISAAEYDNSKEILSQYAKLLNALKPESLKHVSILKLRDFLFGKQKDDDSLNKNLCIINKIKEIDENGSFSKMLKDLGKQLANRLILKLSSISKLIKHPTYENCCVVKLGCKREIYIFCAEDFKYRMRIINDGIIENWKSSILENHESEREALKNRESKYDNYIEYKLNEEESLASIIKFFVKITNK